MIFFVCIFQNFIRYNLFFYSRFMRIQNEGIGKSFWWVINLDVKFGKIFRRRVNSMEIKNYEKRRGRVKKKVEVMRVVFENSSFFLIIEDYLDFLLSFQLSFDFRFRVSFNVSSCGRLLFIFVSIESDFYDNQVFRMFSIYWGQELDIFGNYLDVSYDFIISSLVDGMKLDGSNMGISEEMGFRMDFLEIEMMVEGGMVQLLFNNS